tara:strand:+ start:2441 stop:5095 length:2655 start_codon:yes stop_codon:yes gene_type:complete
MADINYSVGVETARANANLNKLKTNIKSTSSAFAGLKTAIASIAVGALIRNNLLLADSMVNMARATGISVANITAFSQAMGTSGGTADRARDAISDLTKNLGQAAAGSSELQSAFGQVGVSLTDLAKLSTEDIFKKAIEGLTEIPDRATRSSVAMRLFGESTKGVDLDSLSDSFVKNQAGAEKQSQSIIKAAAAQTKLTENIDNFRLALFKVIAPLTTIISKITISVPAFESLLKVVLALSGAFLIFRKVIPWVGGLSLAFAALFATSGKGIKSISLFGGHLKEAGQHLKNVGAGAATAGSRIGSLGLAFGGLFKGLLRFAGVAGIIYAVAEAANAAVRAITGFDAMKTLTDKIGQGWDWVKGKLGFATEETKKVKDATEEVADAQRKVVTEVDKQKDAVRAVKDASIELIKATVAIADGYRIANAELIEGLKLTRDRIGLSAEEVGYQETISNFQKQHKTQIEALNQKLKDQNLTTEAGRKNYAAIKEQIALLTGEYNQQLPIVTKLAAEIKAKTIAVEAAAEAARLETERVQELANAVARATESASDFGRKMAQSTKDAQNELAMLNMDELAKSIFKIKTGLNRDVAGEVRKLQALIDETGDPNGAIKQQIDSITAAGQQAIQAQSELAVKSYQYQRSWSYGWSKAFKDYQSDATNSAKRAASVFSKATKGMEDSIVSFAKTGKFEWKGFVSSILEELLRAQIQQTIAQVFGAASPPRLGGSGSSGGGGLGSVIDGIGSLFGGSSAPSKSPSKSSGGGFMDTISSIGSTIGSLFGGSSGPSKSSGGGFMDTISSAASGVGKFFSGFFANGGMIPAGGYGIVGERGPEMVSGPGMVTPMSGGNNVTYNINAVDASSFASLVARDPGLIYAVTEQGRRSLATRR